MRVASFGWSGAVLIATIVGLATPALADRGKDAKKAYEEATAAFGLGRYAVAAEKYEAAFSLRPDPALLYNAAQSYRLAGNKQRALELYRNCLRLYPDFPNAEDARNHVATLKKQIEDEQRVGTAPPAAAATPPPVTAPPAPPTPATAQAPALPPPAAMPSPVATPMPAPVLTAPPPASSGSTVAVLSSGPPANASQEEPLTRKTWFWVAVGAVAVAAGATAIVLATRGTSYPDPSFGKATGN